MTRVLINFSGHPLSSEAVSLLADEFSELYTVEPFEFDFDGDALVQIDNLVERVPYKLDGTQPITIIPPGHSAIATLLCAYLHGMLGFFPEICVMQLSKSGVYVPHRFYRVPLQGFRNRGRAMRVRNVQKGD